MSRPYPDQAPQRDRWILARRSTVRPPLDPRRPYEFLVEEERSEAGERVLGAVVFLTNQECPWRCLMCDLWRNTLTEKVPVGAIPAQIDAALGELEAAKVCRLPLPSSDRSASLRPQHGPPVLRQIKLYNSGSFFDPQAIPPEDHQAIAWRVGAFDRVIVECHPALVNDGVLRFRDLLPNRLEVAMGLETAHPDVLEKLNKRMTLEQFARAAEFLRRHAIALRVFILVQPPFLAAGEALAWARRSLDFAFDCGATVASLIPTRPGNGALDTLAARGEFAPPRLDTLEAAAAYGVQLGRGRVFADLWDLEKFSTCARCFPARYLRLRGMNHTQTVPPPIACAACGGEAAR